MLGTVQISLLITGTLSSRGRRCSPPHISGVMMRDEILTYWEMCSREGLALQKGMYFRRPPAVSIVLMSQRPGAPYDDSLSDDGRILTYEGHDIKKAPGVDPKAVDQPWAHPDGDPTDNAKFANSVSQENEPLVRVYEKLRSGIWSSGRGHGGEDFRRAIPSWVKQVVYKRDGGKCVICGEKDQLHFDHELPFSKGGTGLSPENVRILCARHNLSKGAKIE